MPDTDYQAAAPGSALLPYPILKFLLTSEPVLGSAFDTIPDGPFNRELHKLLQNTSALANTFYYYMARTLQVTAGNAPAVTNPLAKFSSLNGAPTTGLVNGLYHSMLYDDYEVTYRYSTTLAKWQEQFRYVRATVVTGVSKNTATIRTPILAAGMDAATIAVTIPTTDDNNDAFAFTVDDLKIFYVNQLDDNEAIIGVLAGLDANTPGVLTFVTSGPLLNDDDHELVTVFERITISA